MSRSFFRRLLLRPLTLALAVGASLLSSAASADDDLPRRVFLGTQVQSVSDETRQRLDLPNTRGVEVLMVGPDSTAAAAGIKQGDVILALGDKDVFNPTSFVDLVSTLRGGTDLVIRINRERKEKTVTASLKPLPHETAADFDVEYSHVKSPAGRLRTVLTLPKNAAKTPAIVLLSGLGNGPAEHPAIDPLGLRGVAWELTRKGFAVLRVDKPGCGDSEGGPARDVGFDSVVDGYIAGVRQLKQHSKIDPDQVYLFAVSLGGMQAPLVAQREPVRGIAVFGTAGTNWIEYLADNARRQMKLSGIDDATIDQAVAQQTAGWTELLKEGRSPDDVVDQNPELAPWVEQTWAEGKYFSGITYKYFQQLGKQDIADAWKKSDGPVLALWGESDFVTSSDAHEEIANTANQKRPGRGEFRKIPGVDHNLREAATIEEAVRNMRQPGAALATTVTDAVASWLKETVQAEG